MSLVPADAQRVQRWGCGCLTYVRPDARKPGQLMFVLDPCPRGAKGECDVARQVKAATQERGLPVRITPRAAYT